MVGSYTGVVATLRVVLGQEEAKEEGKEEAKEEAKEWGEEVAKEEAKGHEGARETIVATNGTRIMAVAATDVAAGRATMGVAASRAATDVAPSRATMGVAAIRAATDVAAIRAATDVAASRAATTMMMPPPRQDCEDLRSVPAEDVSPRFVFAFTDGGKVLRDGVSYTDYGVNSMPYTGGLNALCTEDGRNGCKILILDRVRGGVLTYFSIVSSFWFVLSLCSRFLVGRVSSLGRWKSG
jgi:hypothetical protein